MALIAQRELRGVRQDHPRDRVWLPKAGNSIWAGFGAPCATTDAAGTLGNEFVMKNGAGSQLTNLNRWGDYSAMTVDPVDDCTFWFTTEYLKASGTFNWSTWISSFKLAGCQ